MQQASIGATPATVLLPSEATLLTTMLYEPEWIPDRSGVDTCSEEPSYATEKAVVSAKRSHALKILRELEKRAERSYVSPYAFALIHVGLDNRAQALQMIQRTCEDGNEMLGFLKLTPEFDGLRSDQIFARLLHRNRFFAMAG